jgi:ferredoxin-NADP reductase
VATDTSSGLPHPGLESASFPGKSEHLSWQIATVKRIETETPRVKAFTLTLSNWIAHLPGQHYDVRLTAPDGYQAQRSYSAASNPERKGEVELAVTLLEDGEVSSYMHNVLVPGDRIQVRGPIGGYFVWEADMGGPLFLIAGGSGIAPLMAMIRHRAASGSKVPARLLFSSRSLDDIIYRKELETLAADGSGFEVFHTLTSVQPPGWTGYSRLIDEPMLSEVVKPLLPEPRVYVCGPTPLVEAVANILVKIGIPTGRIRTERFGPTGGKP